MESQTTGASDSMQNIGQRIIRNLCIALPPLSQQGKIVAMIEDSTRTLNAAISRAGSEITLLQEYRTRLIADVVTGKLDVREAAAKLPDELAEDPKDLEDSTEEEISESEEESEDNDEN